jgi:hypothetical protein
VNRRHSIFDALWPPVVVLVAVIVVLQVGAGIMDKPYLLPTPMQVVRAIERRHQDLLASLWTTAEASLIGFACSVVAGIGIGIALSASGFFPDGTDRGDRPAADDLVRAGIARGFDLRVYRVGFPGDREHSHRHALDRPGAGRPLSALWRERLG